MRYSQGSAMCKVVNTGGRLTSWDGGGLRGLTLS